MKLLTLNAHSLIEPDYEQKLKGFISGVLEFRPEVIALQEVNQRVDTPPAGGEVLAGFAPAGSAVPVRADNHAARAVQLLREAGVSCSWSWLPVKLGYGRYDEGLAILLLKGRIARVESCRISQTDDYANWKTRRVLAVQPEGAPDWFCSVHMGWWGDAQEPFAAQWETLARFIARLAGEGPVWLMGDFNAPAEVRGESYDCICRAGWHDCWTLAERRSGSATIPGVIDGWRNVRGGARIDHIWCSRAPQVKQAAVVFDGVHQPVVSDHFGVMIETRQLRLCSKDRREAL